MAIPSLEARQLEVWRGDYCVCIDLNFRINSGQVLHLLGDNGAGKTSLIRVLTGLAPPDEGEVLHFGKQASSIDGRSGLRYLAHRDGIKLELTPRENLRLAARMLPEPASESISWALEQVGIGALADRRAVDLSAGQRRRTALARLLLGEPRLWILDEPLVNLDRRGVDLVAELVSQQISRGGTVVLATHQPVELDHKVVHPVHLPNRKRRVH